MPVARMSTKQKETKNQYKYFDLIKIVIKSPEVLNPLFYTHLWLYYIMKFWFQLDCDRDER